MIVADTSVVVAGFASWHEAHDAARAALDVRPRLPAPAAVETYAVLTRLPAPHRAPASLVLDFLEDRFPDPYLALTPGRIRRLLAELGGRGVHGSATYDALIAATARAHDAALVTLDRRALLTYERLGARVEFLGT